MSWLKQSWMDYLSQKGLNNLLLLVFWITSNKLSNIFLTWELKILITTNILTIVAWQFCNEIGMIYSKFVTKLLKNVASYFMY